MGSFRRFFGIFLEFFYNFLENFCDFLENFYNFFGKFYNFLRFFGKFFRKFLPTIRYGSTGVSPYCKFTSKFTPKFTPILIKILQSTKFEGSHFFNSFQVFPLFALFALRHRVFSTMAPLPKRYQWPSLPLRRRRYVGNTRDYK